MAIGVYLRKAIIDNLQNKMGIVIDIALLGKFLLLPDLDAGDALYPKKIIFEPNAAIASATSSASSSKHLAQFQIKTFDMARM